VSRYSNITSGHWRKQIYGRERWEKSAVMVNRAPVLTLWAAVVEVLGGQRRRTAAEDAQRGNGDR